MNPHTRLHSVHVCVLFVNTTRVARGSTHIKAKRGYCRGKESLRARCARVEVNVAVPT